MAAREKICEFSGEYASWDMYGYKRDQLQIMPKYRRLFRGAKAKLYVKRDDLHWVKRCSRVPVGDPLEHIKGRYAIDGPLTKREINGYLRDYHGQGYLAYTYDYTFVVEDPALAGRVDGEYSGYSHDLTTVKRKLRRLLRCRSLEVEYVDNQQIYV